MAKRKIVYDNWIAENGIDPEPPASISVSDFQFISIDELVETLAIPASIGGECHDDDTLQTAVRAAVAKLDEEERELVERIYFMGIPMQELVAKSGRRRHSLEALHRRCRKKLFKLLLPFIDKQWGGRRSEGAVTCVICHSPFRKEIDTLIAGRDKTLTWKPVLKEVRDTFGLSAVTVQLLRGHEQYH